MSAATMVGRKQKPRPPSDLPPAERLAWVHRAVRGDLVRVARILGLPEGEAPGVNRYHELGRVAVSRVYKITGTRRWSAAMDRLRLGHSRNRRRTPYQALVRDLQRVAILLGRPDLCPSQEEYATHGRFSHSLLSKRLSPTQRWEDVAKFAGLQWAPVKRRDLTDEQLVEDYRRVARALGYTVGGRGPGQVKFGRHVDYSPNLARGRFGSWAAYQKAAGFVPTRCRHHKPTGAT